MADKPTYEELEQRVKYLEQEVVKRKQAEDTLRKPEDKYHHLYDNAPDMFVSVDAKTAKIVECNQTLSDTLGYTKEEIIGRPVFDMYTSDSAEYAIAHVFPVFVKTGKIEGEELQLQRKDGSAVDVLLKVSSVRDAQGEILYSISSWRDITERKRAEDERERLIGSLEAALANIKTLKGLLPICAACKRIRDDEGYWLQIEAYIRDHSEAVFSHSVCPECAKKLYPELYHDNK